MSRPLRIQYPGAVYHLMNRGSAGRKVFLSRTDYREFLKTVSEAHDLWGVEVFAYCLMPNHYHLCLRTPRGNLSSVMRHVDGLYTQRFNRRHNRDGSLFRGRYKAIVVAADEYLLAVVRYIHLNPVGARLARQPEEYMWSSHEDYLSGSKSVPWLKSREVLDHFESIEDFHRFVQSGNEEGIEEFYGSKKQSPVLGGEGFRDRVMRDLRSIGREHPRYERISVRPSAERVLKVVARVYGGRVEDLVRSRRGEENEGRKVGMYLMKRLSDMTLGEVAREFGVKSYGAVGWACHGIHLKREADGKFRRRLENLETAICQQKT